MNLLPIISKSIQDKLSKVRLYLNAGSIGQFYRDGGNVLLFNNIPLNENDIVIDAGGYHGNWTDGIVIKYKCRCLIFEPVPEFAEICKTRFENVEKVTVYESALGSIDSFTEFAINDFGTSEFKVQSSSNVIKVQIRSISKFIDLLLDSGMITSESGSIGCLKLNIEGGEYGVLEDLISTGYINKIRCILVQFHKQPSDYLERYSKILKLLEINHKRTWCYEMVWERWDLK